LWCSFENVSGSPSTTVAGDANLARMRPPHDVGGMTGFGAIERETDEPPFHHEWEARVFALNRRLLQLGIYNLDEFRFAVERMPPAAYLASSYYEKWFVAIELLLREKGVLA
jgi:nitrile hydratase